MNEIIRSVGFLLQQQLEDGGILDDDSITIINKIIKQVSEDFDTASEERLAKIDKWTEEIMKNDWEKNTNIAEFLMLKKQYAILAHVKGESISSAYFELYLMRSRSRFYQVKYETGALKVVKTNHLIFNPIIDYRDWYSQL